MKRKVNAVGTGTLTISLPSEWTKRRSIRKGDELDVSEEGDFLVVGGSPAGVRKTTQLQINGGNHLFLRSIVGSMFRSGADEIEISVTDKSMMPAVRKTLSVVMGCEFYATGEKNCVIRNIVERYEFDAPSLMRKMTHTLMVIHDQVLDALRTGKADSVEDVGSLREDLAKYRNLMGRMLVGKGHSQPVSIPYLMVAFYLSSAGGIYRELYSYLAEHKQTIKPVDVKLLEDIGKYLRDLMTLKSTPRELHERYYALDKKVLSVDCGNLKAYELAILRIMFSTETLLLEIRELEKTQK